MNPSFKKEEISDDPFAADIFASGRTEQIETEEPFFAAAAVNSNPWSNRLPQVSPQVADWDYLQRNLSSVFSENLARELGHSLSDFLNSETEKAFEFSFLSQSEINRAEDFTAANCWRLTIAVAQSKAEIAFEIDDLLAARAVDAMLGEADLKSGRIRDLTLSEQAVLEFLALNLIAETNSFIGAPLFEFRSFAREIPSFLQKNVASEKPSLLVFNWQMTHDFSPAIIKCYFTPEAVKALQPKENRLLDAQTPRCFSVRNLPVRIKDARMRLFFGEAEISFAEVSALEKDDIVLLEKHDLAIYGGEISGRAKLFLGDGDNVTIGGEFSEGYFAPDDLIVKNAESSDNEVTVQRLNSKTMWQIVIENLEETPVPAALAKFMTETDSENKEQNTEENADEGVGFAVENLAVTLRVELEARRLSLAEIGNLRENQILELGIKPTDTVNLLIDNQMIGRGELVAVEDRLGVRITKILR